MNKINVLSLFDGMSCGQQALERVGIEVENYYASEIDKYAIKVTQANYPNTIQLGSVVNVDGYKLPKIDLLIGGSPCQSFSFAGKRKGMSTKDEQEILTLEHYLQLKAEQYEFEGQSYLFWEFMRLLNECKPKYFLLENVEMGEKWEKVLSKAIGVNGIHINSALVSAQNRKRIYWTNIGMIPGGLFGDLESIIQQPKDKGVLLKDILESEVDEKYFLSQKMIEGFERHKERHNDKGTEFAYFPKNENHKGNTALCPTDNIIKVHNTMPRSSTTGKGGTGHLSRNDGKTYCLDTGNTNAIEINVFDGYNNRMRTDEKCGSITQHCSRESITNGFKVVVPTNAVELPAIYDDYNSNIKKDGKSCTLTINTGSKSNRNGQKVILPSNTNAVEIKAIMLGRSKEWGAPEKNDGKSYTLCKEQPHGIILTSKDKRLKQTIDENDLTVGQVKALDTYNQSIHDRYPTLTDPKHNDRALFDGLRIRRLTPIECERLQTVKDNYTNYVSDSQRYKMLGNGWTIDVIAHIFSYLK